MSALEEQAQAPYVGKILPDRAYTIDATALASYFRGLDLEPVPAPFVPSTILSQPDNDYIHDAGYAYRVGHLWIRQRWEFFHPLNSGSTYAVRGKILDIYPHRDRNVVKYETTASDENGVVAARSEHHQSFLKAAPDSGEVKLRDPSSKPGARTFDVPAGKPFGGLERRISVEMCGDFFHGKSSYHTDANASKALGFKDIVVGGRMTMAYAAHALERQFPDTWSHSGRLEVKFTNPVWALDVITVHGVVTGPLEDDPERTGAFVWITNADGTVVLVANASVIEG